MHEQVVALFEGERRGGGPDVALGVPVSLEDAVEASDEHVVSDVEFPALVQQRLLYVLLEDECPYVAIVAFLLAF